MKAPKNRAASIRARLKNIADARQQDFDLTLTRYGLERLLYRLSISRHADHFMLKGALLFALWFDAPTRPTRDADLLGFGAADVDSIGTTFRWTTCRHLTSTPIPEPPSSRRSFTPYARGGWRTAA